MSLPRAVVKPPKVYFFDNADTIGDEGVLEELIEVKYSDEEISRSLLYYANRLKPKKATQIVARLNRPFDKNGITVIDPISYFDHFFDR